MANITSWVVPTASHLWAFAKWLLAPEKLDSAYPQPDGLSLIRERTFFGDLLATEHLEAAEPESTVKPVSGGVLRELVRFDSIPLAPTSDAPPALDVRNPSFFSWLFSRERIADESVNEDYTTVKTQETP